MEFVVVDVSVSIARGNFRVCRTVTRASLKMSLALESVNVDKDKLHTATHIRKPVQM